MNTSRQTGIGRIVSWFQRLLFKPRPAPPLLVRFHHPDDKPDGTRAVQRVEVRATLFPSRRTIERVIHLAQGVGVMPLGQNDRSHFLVRSSDAFVEFWIDARDAGDGIVRDVTMTLGAPSAERAHADNRAA